MRTHVEVRGRWRRVDGGRVVRFQPGRYRWRAPTVHGTLTVFPPGAPVRYEARRDDGAPGVCGRGRTPADAIAEAPGPDGAGSWYA